MFAKTRRRDGGIRGEGGGEDGKEGRRICFSNGVWDTEKDCF
jgi:hypothetical protein